MQATLKSIAIVASLLLTACSEGTGSSSILGSLVGENAGANSASGVETGVGNQTQSPLQDDFLSLDRLIGTVNMNYRFNVVDGEYFKQFTFSAADKMTVVDEETQEETEVLLKEDTANGYYCQIIVSVSSYMCLTLGSETLALEVFLFSLGSNGQGSGTYEYCSSDEDPEACGRDLRLDSDGTVDVAVNAAVAARNATSSGDVNSITVDSDMHKLVSDQADSPLPIAPATVAEKALADAINLGIRRLPIVQ